MFDRLIIVAVIIGSLLLLFKLLRNFQLSAARRTNSAEIKENQILYFSSSACTQCLMQKKILQQVLDESGRTDIRLKKYSIENNPETTRQWKVVTLPTVILLSNNGQVVNINNGLTPIGTLRSQLESLPLQNY